jgi:hypothetical protein
MIRINVPQQDIHQFMKGWGFDYDLAMSGPAMRIADATTFTIKEIVKENLGMNLDTKDPAAVTVFVVDSTISTIKKAATVLGTAIKVPVVLNPVVASALGIAGSLYGAYSLMQDAEAAKKIADKTIQRNKAIEYAKKNLQKEKEQREYNYKGLKEEFEKGGTVYDNVKPPRIKTPPSDKGDEGTMVA